MRPACSVTMKTSLSCLLSILFVAAISASAQTAIDELFLDMVRVVEDADGYTNLRAKPSTEAKITGKVLSGGVIAITSDSNGKWAEVMQDNFNAPKAYIHTSRLRRLDQWKHIEVGDWSRQKEASLKLDGVEVRVTEVPFDASAHKITKDENQMVLVDGLSPWGQDGGMPRQEMKLDISVNGQPLKLPAEATRNLYEPNVGSLALLTPSTADNHLLIVMHNSDGAGGYIVVWAFQRGAYIGRTAFTPF